MNKVALYVRVSTDEQAQGHSINAQLEKLREFANEKGYKIYKEYIDTGYSGGTDDRPSLKDLMFDAGQSKFQEVLVYRYDRFFRDVRLFLNAEHFLRSNNIKLTSITESIDDTLEGRLQLLIKGSFAEYEKAVILHRAEMGRNRAAKEGKWMGGPPPYGYSLDEETSKLVINQKEAQWVKKFFQWLVEDRLTLYQLQQKVNSLNIPTRFEEKKKRNPEGWWAKRTLGRILTKEIYTGRYYYRKVWKPREIKYKDAKIRPQEEWIEIKVPRIISDKLFRLAQMQLKRNSELSPRRTKREYMLAKLIRCGECGRVWVAGSNNRGCVHYICSSRRGAITGKKCTVPSIAASKIEPVIWNKLDTLLRQPQLVLNQIEEQLKENNELDKYQKEIENVTKEIRNQKLAEQRILEAYKACIINLKTFKEELNKTKEKVFYLEEEKDRLSQKIENLHNIQDKAKMIESLAKHIYERIDNIDYSEKCKLVHLLIERVIIKDNLAQIHTAIPLYEKMAENKDNLVCMRDNTGVDCPANKLRLVLSVGLPMKIINKAKLAA